MARLICDISTSLDGFVAGPNASLEEPLGAGGELLHEWAFAADELAREPTVSKAVRRMPTPT